MMKREENVKATLKVQGQVHNLKAGIYVVGKTSTEIDHDIVINDASVDVKHAAIEILSAKWRVIDMCSKTGTFVENSRLQPLQAKDIPDQATIKFGAISCEFNAKEDDDEDMFGDSPFSDIIPGSPELSIKSQPLHSGTSRIRNRSQKVDFTSQIEKTVTSQKETSKVTNLEAKQKDESLLEPEAKEVKQESFAVPGPIAAKPKDENFLIPSTQNRLSKTNLNSTKEFRTSVCAFEEDEDDFFIPETQEFTAHSDSRSSKSDEIIRLATEDFNSEDDDICLQSQNVLQEAASFLNNASDVIPYIKPTGDLSKPMSGNPNAEDDKEMSALEWNETNVSHLKPVDDIKSTSVTPDLDFDDDEAEPEKGGLSPVKVVDTEDLPATQLFLPPVKDIKSGEDVFSISPSNKENVPNVCDKTKVVAFAVPFPVRKSDSKRESCFKEPEKMKINSPILNKSSNAGQIIPNDDDDDLQATQIFDASDLKTSKAPQQNDDDDLLPTQVFNASQFLEKKTTKPEVNSEDLLDKTQPFFMSPKKPNNKDSDGFVRPEEFRARKLAASRVPVIFESDDEELSDPEMHMAATLPIGEEPSAVSRVANELPRNKIFSSDDEDDANDKIIMGPPLVASTSTKSLDKSSENKKAKMNKLFGSDDEDSSEKEGKRSKTSSSSKSSTKRTTETTPPKKGVPEPGSSAKIGRNRRKSTILMDIPDTPDFINLKLPTKDKLKTAGELFSRESVTAKLTFPFEQSSDEEDIADKTVPFEADKGSVKEEETNKSEKPKAKSTKEEEIIQKIEEDSDSSGASSTKVSRPKRAGRRTKTKDLEKIEEANGSDSSVVTSVKASRTKPSTRSKSVRKPGKVQEDHDSDSSAITMKSTASVVSSKSAKESTDHEVRKSSRSRTKPKRIDEEERDTKPAEPSRTSKRRLHNVTDQEELLKNIKTLQKEDKRKRESSALAAKTSKKRSESKATEPEVPEKRTRLRSPELDDGRIRILKKETSTEKASTSSSGKLTSCDSESSPTRKSSRPVRQRVVFTKIESSPFEKKLRRMETRSRPLRN